MSANTASEPSSRRRAGVRCGFGLVLLMGCQAPFGSDRHRLEDFRIAGVQLEAVDATTLQASPLLVVDGRLWSDAPTDLAWVWLDEDDDPATWTGRADAAGTWPTLQIPQGGGRLLLVAISPDGTSRRAVARVDDTLQSPPDVLLELSPGRSVNEGQKLTE